jgi:predicted alpha/beta hydrolase
VGLAAEVSGVRGTARAHDGFPLAVTRFTASGTPWAGLVIANAMGVRQEFYAPLAEYLAAHGIHVLTFDYRGTFASRAGKRRGFRADLMTWATQDLDAMLLEADDMAAALPVFYLGHSLGGQLLGVLPNNGRVRAAITVTAGSGWYRFNDRMPWQVRIFWFLAIPLLTPLFGRFPGKPLRMVGDLPAGVAWQWRRWCLHPDYIHSQGPEVAAAFERVRAPITSYSFEDDPIITRPAIDDLHRRYTQAIVERRHVAPGELDRASISHFGFFAEASRETLWAEALRKLQAGAAPANVEVPVTVHAVP